MNRTLNGKGMEIFVAPDGNDGWPGNRLLCCRMDAPCKITLAFSVCETSALHRCRQHARRVRGHLNVSRQHLRGRQPEGRRADQLPVLRPSAFVDRPDTLSHRATVRSGQDRAGMVSGRCASSGHEVTEPQDRRRR